MSISLATNVTVVAPRYVPGLPDEHAAFRAAIASPIASPPLVRHRRTRRDRVAIVIPDITRPLPSRSAAALAAARRSRTFPTIASSSSTAPARTAPTPRRSCRQWSARTCSHATASSITTRTIRPRSPSAGIGQDGQPVLLNRDYVEADRRIVLGFIEPHFMAGFSGGAKAVFPGSRGHRRDHALPRRAHDWRSEDHLGPAGGEPDAGADPPRRHAACRSTSAST